MRKKNPTAEEVQSARDAYNTIPRNLWGAELLAKRKMVDAYHRMRQIERRDRVQKINKVRPRAMLKVEQLVSEGKYTTASIIAAQHGIRPKKVREMMGKPDLELLNGTKPIFLYLVERVPPPPATTLT